MDNNTNHNTKAPVTTEVIDYYSEFIGKVTHTAIIFEQDDRVLASVVIGLPLENDKPQIAEGFVRNFANAQVLHTVNRHGHYDDVGHAALVQGF